MSSENVINLTKYITPVGFSLLKEAVLVLNSAFCRLVLGFVRNTLSDGQVALLFVLKSTRAICSKNKHNNLSLLILRGEV